MDNEQHEFERFMQRRLRAAQAYGSGDIGPLAALLTAQSPATFFGPKGGSVQGAQAVAADYERGAKLFEPGGESSLEILHQGASGGLAYWVGIQRATTRMRGRPDPVSFALRITELFRREGDDWKLIHRHADPLASGEQQHGS